MHLPRPKLFRKRQAKPDKPIRSFFRRFFCVFALCMTAPQPVTISQEEQTRFSGSNGRHRRQRAPKYEQKMSSGNVDTDSLFTTSEISVGLPVVQRNSYDTNTQDQNVEHTFSSICDPITPLDDFNHTITTISNISGMSSITSDGISECNKAIEIEPKEVFVIPKAKSCITLSESATGSAKVIPQWLNNDVTDEDKYNDITYGQYTSSPMPYEYFNAEEFSKERFIKEKSSSRCVSKSNSVVSFHDTFDILNGSFGKYDHKDTKSKINDKVEGNDDKVERNDDKVKGNDEKKNPIGHDIATTLINDVIENLFESKVNQNRCEPETSNNNGNGTEMIIKSTEHGTSNNENNSVKAEHRTLDNNKDDSELAGTVNNDENPTDDVCGFGSDFLNNIIENVCNKPPNRVESLNDVDAEIKRLLEDYEIVSHGKNKVFQQDAEIERLLEDYEIKSQGKSKEFEHDKMNEKNQKNNFKNLHLKPPIKTTNKNRKICSASNGIRSKSPVLARPTTTNNPTRQNYIYLNETYESNNLSAERLSPKKFQNNNTFKKNNGIDKYVNETHHAFKKLKETSQPKLKQISESDNFPLRRISETINSSLECVTKHTLGRVIEEKIPNIGRVSEHKFWKVSETANVLERVCETIGSSFKTFNDTNKLKLEKTCEITNPAIRPNNDTKQLKLEQMCETINPSIIPVIETRKFKLEQICVPTSLTFIPVIETRKLDLEEICVTTNPTFIPVDTRKLKKEKVSETTNPTYMIPVIETRVLKLEQVCVKATTTIIPVINTRKFKLEQIHDTSDSRLEQLNEVKTSIVKPESTCDTSCSTLSPVVSQSSQSKLEQISKRSSYALGHTNDKESGYASSKNIHERSLKTIHQVILEEEEEEEEYAESTIINAESSIINDDDDMNGRNHL